MKDLSIVKLPPHVPASSVLLFMLQFLQTSRLPSCFGFRGSFELQVLTTGLKTTLTKGNLEERLDGEKGEAGAFFLYFRGFSCSKFVFCGSQHLLEQDQLLRAKESSLFAVFLQPQSLCNLPNHTESFHSMLDFSVVALMYQSLILISGIERYSVVSDVLVV